jgi:HEAT repeat protein
VRVQAALTLASKRDERAAQAILGVISTPDFGRRDLSERQAFFEALGRSGSDSLLAKLEPILTKGSLFRAGSDEERFHAALALAWLGSPAALGVLNRELQGKKNDVKKAVEAALAVVRSAGGVGTRPENKSPVDDEEGG